MIEAESELVQVIGEVPVTDGALVRAQQPPLGSDITKCTESLICDLGSAEIEICHSAIRTLISIGSEAVPALTVVSICLPARETCRFSLLKKSLDKKDRFDY